MYLMGFLDTMRLFDVDDVLLDTSLEVTIEVSPKSATFVYHKNDQCGAIKGVSENVSRSYRDFDAFEVCLCLSTQVVKADTLGALMDIYFSYFDLAELFQGDIKKLSLDADTCFVLAKLEALSRPTLLEEALDLPQESRMKVKSARIRLKGILDEVVKTKFLPQVLREECRTFTGNKLLVLASCFGSASYDSLGSEWVTSPLSGLVWYSYAVRRLEDGNSSGTPLSLLLLDESVYSALLSEEYIEVHQAVLLEDTDEVIDTAIRLYDMEAPLFSNLKTLLETARAL